MSLTGKTINELPLLTSYSAGTYIPVYYSGGTFKATQDTLEPIKKWSGLLTQTGPQTFTGNTDPNLYGGLVLNEIYTIDSYTAGDNFSNIAQVLSGVINTTGCVFKVTGSTSTDYFFPTTWVSSQITSQGDMIVYILENTLGFDVVVEYPGFGVLDGVVVFYPDVPSGGFLPQKTYMNAQPTIPYDFSPTIPNILTTIDRQILAGVMYILDPSSGLVSNNLNNTPVEIIVYK
jgi:hypothetical protein